MIAAVEGTKLYGICVVKNEDDVIEQTLNYASQYCDKIFVTDNGSTDETWDIVQRLAKDNEKVVAFARRLEPFDEGLRWFAYDAHHRELTEKDWWLVLDGDEFLAEDPRLVIEQAMIERADIINAWQVQFYFTEKDYEAWKVGLDDRARPIYERRRYYRIDWQEPRLFRNQREPNRIFRQSKLLTGDTAAWGAKVERRAGKLCRRRILNRHYQYRDPPQIEQRLKLRMETVRSFVHVKALGSSDLSVVLRASKDLDYYQEGDQLRFRVSGLLSYYPKWFRRAVRRRLLSVAKKLRVFGPAASNAKGVSAERESAPGER